MATTSKGKLPPLKKLEPSISVTELKDSAKIEEKDEEASDDHEAGNVFLASMIDHSIKLMTTDGDDHKELKKKLLKETLDSQQQK